MNANSIIINALSPLGYPVKPDVYTGTESIYFTFNYSDDRSEDFADDEPQNDVAYMQIHLFTPQTFNITNLKKQARMKLFQAGFTYPSIQQFYENDTKMNHVVFTCQIDGQPETEE